MTVQLPKHRFTVDEYHRMAQASILAEDERVERLEGEIIQISPTGQRHAACVNGALSDAQVDLLRTAVAGLTAFFELDGAAWNEQPDR